MKKLLASTVIALSATAAVAGPTCNVPQETWMKESDFKARLEAQGYQIKTFKVSKGKCYEIYGFDKDGKKVEIYFDPATAAALETKR
ncbi:PepSY domain-containing protein [Aromatoleum bremense]|uniref:PepSY domain-containing protein n=1 Tax=Aromatoleum bremense TaxID=76115 RepID=A0ABX1P0V7_9RHOO|nr:PepSY domain-containing protein [Aromatoleum bremense]NMG17621.1 PepSY domain-containing protein [Aromatoleum bremense]QTQ33104.1 PepSY domain-containing protein [Aromatoleum bremense]